LAPASRVRNEEFLAMAGNTLQWEYRRPIFCCFLHMTQLANLQVNFTEEKYYSISQLPLFTNQNQTSFKIFHFDLI
jgi:hypothetical protein